MDTISDIRITIEYQLVNDETWKRLEIEPEEFFDLLPGEPVRFGAVPKHNHAIHYLNVDVRTVRMTKLTLSDKAQKAERVIRETFWNDGQNRVIEREDGSFAPYWEAIVETKISEFPPVWEVLRLGRRQGILIPWYHGFIRDNEDGSQTETKVSLASLT